MLSLDKQLKEFEVFLDAPVACFVSGGVDSMVLMELLYRFRLHHPVEATVVHFNHHLRGEESNDDQAFVEAESLKRNFSFLPVEAPLKKGGGIQERSRNLRRDNAEKLARDKGFKYILLAHHADDQAETVIMNCLRGAEMRGLKGMEPVSPLADGVWIIRPLLNIRRKDILQFVRDNTLSYREDSSNKTDVYLRNRIRHHLIPQLERASPECIPILLDRSKKLRSSFSSALQKTRNFLSTCSLAPSSYRIPKKKYLEENSDVRFLVLERCLLETGFKKQVLKKHFLELESMIQRDQAVEKGYGESFVQIDKDHFTFSFTDSDCRDASSSAWSLEIPGPGDYWISPLNRFLSLKNKLFMPQEKTKNRNTLYLSQKTAAFPLVACFLKSGLRFRPFGCRGHKKLSDFFIDKKVPRFERDKVLLLCKGYYEKDKLQKHSSILCVVGHEIDESCRVESSSNSSLAVFLSPVLREESL